MELPNLKASKIFLIQTPPLELNENSILNHIQTYDKTHKAKFALKKSHSLATFGDSVAQKCSEGILNHPSNLSIFPSSFKSLRNVAILKSNHTKIRPDSKYPYIIPKMRNMSSNNINALDHIASEGMKSNTINGVSKKVPNAFIFSSSGTINMKNNNGNAIMNNSNTNNTNVSSTTNIPCIINTNNYMLMKEDNLQYKQLRLNISGKRIETPLKPFMDKDLTSLYNRYSGNNNIKNNDITANSSPKKEELLPFSRNIKLFKKMNSIHLGADVHTPNNIKLKESKSEKLSFPKFISTIQPPSTTMNHKSGALLFSQRSDALLEQIAIAKGLKSPPKKIVKKEYYKAINNNSLDKKNATTKEDAETSTTNKRASIKMTQIQMENKPLLTLLAKGADKARGSKKGELITDTDTKDKGKGVGKNISKTLSPEQYLFSRNNSNLSKLKLNTSSKNNTRLQKITDLSSIRSWGNYYDNYAITPRGMCTTGIKSIDHLLNDIKEIIFEIDTTIIEKKDNHLGKMVLNYYQKHPMPDLSIKSPFADTWPLMQKTIKKASMTDAMIDFPYPGIKGSCSVPIPCAIYLYNTYLLYDQKALSDYIFGIKSDFIENNLLEPIDKTSSEIKVKIEKTKTNAHIERSSSRVNMLHVQRFIKNDSNLLENDLLMKHLLDDELFEDDLKGGSPYHHGYRKNESCRSINFVRSSTLRKRKMKNNFDSKFIQSLDVLKYKHIYVWRKDKLDNSRRMSATVDQINHSPAVLKQIVFEIYSCFKANKCNWGMDTEELITTSFIGDDQQVFDVLIRFIPLSESVLFKKCLTYLINFDINLQDKRGNTLLMLAVKENSIEIAKILIEKGANMNIQNDYGNTALHYAASHKFYELYDLLTGSRARENIMNNLGLLASEAFNKNIEDN